MQPQSPGMEWYFIMEGRSVRHDANVFSISAAKPTAAPAVTPASRPQPQPQLPGNKPTYTVSTYQTDYHLFDFNIPKCLYLQ